MKRTLKIFGCAIVIVLSGLTGLYVVLLGMQAYSQRQASHLLDRVEALRLGDSEASFDSAVNGFPLKKTSSGTLCTVTSGAYRFAALWRVIWELPEKPGSSIWTFCNKVGLRYWRLDVMSSAENGRIGDISTYLYVVGRYEALGAEWRIAPTVPSRYDQYLRAPYDQRTYMTWYHITSRPSGEGFAIHATPQTNQDDLLARRINRKCLFAFRGGDGLCELLPDAVPVLEERHTAWGGCSDVPRSWCDLKYDNCRESFR